MLLAASELLADASPAVGVGMRALEEAAVAANEVFVLGIYIVRLVVMGEFDVRFKLVTSGSLTE